MKPYKILIIAPNWVGDIVMSQSLLIMLRDKYKDNLILDVMANEWTKNILNRMPEINNIIDNPFKHGELRLIKRVLLGIELKQNNYNQAIILTNTLKSAIVPFFANIKKRTGFVGEQRYLLLNDIYKLNKQKLPRLIDQYCFLAQANNLKIKLPRLSIDKNNQANIIKQYDLSNKKIIVIAPGAEYGPAKRWPVDYFIELTRLLKQTEYYILILGAKKDQDIANKIANSSDNKKILNLVGTTSLSDTVDIIDLATYTITNDSGLMHVASATSSRVIAIYGSSTPNYTPPLSPNAIILKINIECSPCFSRTCKFNHYNCLKLITPQMVFDCIK
jgi:heptosyltransferase-2